MDVNGEGKLVAQVANAVSITVAGETAQAHGPLACVVSWVITLTRDCAG